VDFWDATKVLFRRWYLALPLLLITLGVTAYTATAVKPDYVLTSYVQLVPPASIAEKTPTAASVPSNPWSQLGLEALSQAADYATLDQTFIDSLQAKGFSTNFKITVGDPVAGATIEVVAPSRKSAVDTTDAVIQRYRSSAEALQTRYSVRPNDMIIVLRLDQGENLKRPGGKVKRAIIAVFGAGILLMCAVTIGGDALLRRRRPAAAQPFPERGADTIRIRAPGMADAPVSPSALPIPVQMTGGESRDAAEPSNMIQDDATIVLRVPQRWPSVGKDGSLR
jgi:hypothetical protein